MRSGSLIYMLEALFRENEIIVCDEFNWDKLSAEAILSIISPREVILNKKGSSVRLRRKKCLIARFEELSMRCTSIRQNRKPND